MIKSRLIELVETGSLIAPCFSKYSPQGSAGVINLPDNKVFSKAMGGSRVSGKGCQRGHRQEAENHKATCVVSRQTVVLRSPRRAVPCRCRSSLFFLAPLQSRLL